MMEGSNLEPTVAPSTNYDHIAPTGLGLLISATEGGRRFTRVYMKAEVKALADAIDLSKLKEYERVYLEAYNSNKKGPARRLPSRNNSLSNGSSQDNRDIISGITPISIVLPFADDSLHQFDFKVRPFLRPILSVELTKLKQENFLAGDSETAVALARTPRVLPPQLPLRMEDIKQACVGEIRLSELREHTERYPWLGSAQVTGIFIFETAPSNISLLIRAEFSGRVTLWVQFERVIPEETDTSVACSQALDALIVASPMIVPGTSPCVKVRFSESRPHLADIKKWSSQTKFGEFPTGLAHVCAILLVEKLVSPVKNPSVSDLSCLAKNLTRNGPLFRMSLGLRLSSSLSTTSLVGNLEILIVLPSQQLFQILLPPKQVPKLSTTTRLQMMVTMA